MVLELDRWVLVCVPQTALLTVVQVNIKGSYFLEEDPFYFDAPFFAMTQSEANGTDGQQRLMLEVAYETLENGWSSLEILFPPS